MRAIFSRFELALTLCLVTAFALQGAACEDRRAASEAGAPAAPALDPEREAAEREARRAAERAVTFERIERGQSLIERDYELLVLDLASCEIDRERAYLKQDCEALMRLNSQRARRNETIPDPLQMWHLISQRALKEPSPAVRLYATQLLSATARDTPEAANALLKSLAEERSPEVLRALIRGVRQHASTNPDVATRLLELSAHEDEGVREDALIGLTSVWAAGSQGTLERALEMVERDPSERVRQVGCEALGNRADERALPLLKRFTAWPPEDKAIYAACLQGLIGMWSAPSPHKSPSKAAYELTVERLSETPRDAERPAWTALSRLNWASHPELLKRAPFINLELLRSVLTAIVADERVNWLGRNSAITVLVNLGATARDLELVRDRAYAKIDDASSDRYVLNKLNEQIAELRQRDQTPTEEKDRP